MYRFIFAFLTIASPLLSIGQCEVTEKVLPDGTMYYYAETVLFYNTASFRLSGNIVTDKEHYFLNLKPLPYPEKPKGTKLKKSISVVLDNDSTYTLEFFDAWYHEEDTSYSISFQFNKKDIDPFRRTDVKQVSIDLGDGAKDYVFRLHKGAVRRQLECFIKPKNKL